ncbi:MAG: methylated-DNA--[protein]-cysteine S-methyltransferase [Thalassobaculum sp.]|uniref:methylated-DNA--[protein]-cysteine S-methyltransferase n=1 Tax=Thalassobaculum sp. TaxID=2022740 RepID=UPI0032EACA67
MAASDIDTPTGRVRVVSDGEAIVGIGWIAPGTILESPDEDSVSRETAAQLEAYFAGRLTAFDIPIRFRGGSLFERAVWMAMCEIPCGETRTYGDLAALTGGVARAVGGACGRNPIPIVVPCHRVVGSDGKLVGFSGAEGVATKQWLLDFERGQARLF